jgi:hypothetical protein
MNSACSKKRRATGRFQLILPAKGLHLGNWNEMERLFVDGSQS